MYLKGKKSIRFITLLLACLMAASCGESGSADPDATVSGGSETTSSAPETVAPDKDELPEKDFEGREFKVLACESTAYKGYIDVEESNGDILNDSIYESNRAVEDRFNVVIKQEILGAVEANNTATKLLAAGDHEYDIMSMTDRLALQQAVQGLLISYADMPYIDLEKDYWCQSINDTMTIGGEQWLAYGDFNLSVYDYTYALAFNKQLIGELNLDDPYELVNSGKWTYDAFNEMCVSAASDLDGNTVMDDKDRYGWSAIFKQVSPTMWVAAGVNSIKKDSDDLPYFSMSGDQQFQDVYEKIVDIAWNNNAWYISDRNANITEDTMFLNGNALFQTTSFGLLDTGYYRDMKIDYGILPHPKWDENQDSYYTRVEGGRIFGIPITTPDTEFTGVMLEALSASAHENVIPSYFEVCLKTKYTRDDESAQMFDLIMNTRVYDLGDTFWCEKVRDNFMATLFKTGSKDLASAIASNKDNVEGSIQETIDALKK
ncbi:MAG: hypothetical protein ACI4T6_07075 [Candidatus Flemingiibacterium sp.]